jgi:ribosomal protein S18 acetylase RimI-like enzyme
VPPDLLGLAMFRPQQAAALLREYPGELALGWEGGRPVGVLGYRMEATEAIILHIAVDAAWRGRGIGRSLLLWLAGRVASMVAETDGGAVGFYRQCGFSVEPAVERGGTQRYVVRRQATGRAEAGGMISRSGLHSLTPFRPPA